MSANSARIPAKPFVNLLMGLCILLLTWPSQQVRADEAAIKRGKYLFRAAGGCSCHTVPGSSDRMLAGGRPIKTPFGVVFSTNITPDKDTGIGSWSEADFINAMSKGIKPDGTELYPVFPYTSFTLIETGDLKDIKAYLDTVPAVSNKNKPVELPIPFKWRFGLFFWKLLNFKEGRFIPAPDRTASWNRGAYLVNALAHCSECHTPRDITGGLKKKWLFAGSVDGPEGQFAPNITPDMQTGIGKWGQDAMIWFLQSGQKPDGDFVGGLMAEVINDGYQYLNPDDLKAISDYIFSLPPKYNRLKP